MKTINFNGEEKTLTQWSKETGLPRHIIAGRIKLGWGSKEILTTLPFAETGKKKIIQFSEEEILDIVQRYQFSHESPYDIAEKYKKSPSVIYKILKANKIDVNYGRKHYFNEDYFLNIDTPRKAYWLGFIYADACVRQYVFSFGLKKEDRYILEHLAKDVEYTGDIRDESKLRSLNGRKPKIYHTSILNLCSKKMCKHLNRHGVLVNKTFRLNYPNINSVLHAHFIRGLFDGDGYVSFSKQKNRTCIGWGIVGQFDLLSKVIDVISNELLINLNINKSKENLWNMGINYSMGSQIARRLNHTRLDDLLKLREWLYKDSDLHLNRKKTKFDCIKSIPPRSGLSIIDFAKLVGINERTVRRKIKNGEIKSYKEGMYRRIDELERIKCQK